ncbi:MAG: S-layer homology domain-containing protein, partial [Clostridia bacterium]|nr:S-layer homology domain-containing protein [Clostridia bacterium]
DGTLSYAVKSGDAVTVDASSGALTIVKAGTATVTVTASGTATYEQATRDVTVTVNKAAVTVTANAQSKTFGDTDPELTYTAEGLIGEDKLTGALAREDGQDVGEYGITAGTLTAGNNYDIDFTGSKLTINPKDIADAVISFEADAIVYTGDVIEPKITEVKLGDTVLTGDDYEIDADSDASGTNYGTYTLKINGKGNYTGTASKEWKITKTLPTVAELPTASTIRTGSALSTSTLTGGKAVFGDTEVTGTFAWADGTIKPEVADSDTTEYEVIFTPDDMDNFEPVTAKITLTVKKRSSGGGSSSSGSTYAVTTSKTTNGTIKSSTYNAASGTKVTLTVTPKDGYEVDTVTITDKDGNPVEVTKNADGTYSYVQPASKVTIDATYKKEGAEPAVTPAPTTEPQATVKPSDGNSDKWWFKDVPETTWYYNPIKEAFDNSRMSGMSEDYFEPETDITRGMFAYAIYRREDLPETDAQNKFEDVKADTYYEKAIAWATENGIVAGIDDTHYAPDDQITREQMAAILYRYAQFKAYDVSIGEDTNILDFTDAQDISQYAVPAIQWAVGDSVITGFEDGTMRPKANANRAQMAVILNKIADLF